MTRRIVGIDISRNHLDAHCLPEGRTRRFTNDRPGFEALIDWMGSGLHCVAYEPTGPWHRDLEEALQRAEAPLERINPDQLRLFALCLGRQAEAQVLARMAETLDDLRLMSASSQAQRDLIELQAARYVLIDERTATLNEGTQLRLSLLKKLNRSRLQQIEQDLRRVNTEIRKLLESDFPDRGSEPSWWNPPRIGTPPR